ncbi:hypothetical protein GQ44DRAFT_704248 [Phaeosphaeriaceae sp. PMI808]|nr:hypothetical protein GQ44DRAFT_704248 [Phaeosphaeriaceae sp. PMI808]
MVFKVFPCRLLVVGPAMARPPVALTSGQCWPVLTLLSSVKYPAARYLQVPSRHHGEVRVVVGPPLARVCVCVCVSSIMAMHPEGMGRYYVLAIHLTALHSLHFRSQP